MSFAESIAHVDMDAFFVEVERRRRPDLIGKPVLVGGRGPRSVVAAASYEARRFGVHSATPMVAALRRCPHAVVVPPDHREYRRASAQVMAVLESFTPYCEPVSVDEAFLDIGGLRHVHADARSVGESIRSALREHPCLAASIGIATTKLLAKMASRAAKPDGVVVVAAGEEEAFLHPHPVRDLWGVGEATLARLEELGVETVGDIVSFPRDTLIRRIGAAAGGHLWDLAAGIDPRRVEAPAEASSISVEETYASDLVDGDDVDGALLAHADRLASRLRRAGAGATTVHLKVRYGDFTTLTRAHTVEYPLATARDLVAVARRLLGGAWDGRRGIRLLGIGASGLVASDAPRQLRMTETGWEEVEEAVERVRDRFGRGAVERARLLGGGRTDRDAEEGALGILGEPSPPEAPHAPR